MSIWKGEHISLELFGASHAEGVGLRCSGFPAVRINEEALLSFMARRQGGGFFGTTPRREADVPEFRTGVLDGVASGDIEIFIPNQNKRSGDYGELYGKPRPSHADYCDYLQSGNLDFRGGGRFSARLTAPFCAAGYLAKEFLARFGVRAYAYLSSVGKIKGRSYRAGVEEGELSSIEGFPSLTKKKQMIKAIERARLAGDSVGATIECVIYGVTPGVGNDYFEGLESAFSSLLYAIPAVKAVEFGDGFALSRGRGSQMNDPLFFQNGEIQFGSNHAGGINGGIANGAPITLRVGLRPTPSILREQDTVDLMKKENTKIKIGGRHDACVAVRALPLVESAVYLALLDRKEYYHGN